MPDETERERPNNQVSVFPYPGGKGRKADWIISRMPPHTCYVEPFGGSGAILYNKPESSVEVYNDINGDVVQFFRVLRERREELEEWVRAVPYARDVYESWVSDYFDGYRPDDPVARAGRFFTLRYMQFSGEIAMRNGFKVRAKRSPSRTFDNARARLEELSERFRQVQIENSDYQDTFTRYDDSDTDVLFYCDPPYVGGEHYYGREFDHSAFADALLSLESDWMVSYGDLPTELTARLIGAVRSGREELYVIARDRRHRMCRSTSNATEHLVCSFDPTSTSKFLSDGMEQQRLEGTV